MGRALTGIILTDKEYAYLPPFFADRSAAVIDDAIRDSFPNLPASMHQVYQCIFPNSIRVIVFLPFQVAEFCLASLAWRVKMGDIKSLYPSEHMLFKTSLFTSGMIDKLAQLVDCRLTKVGDRITTTGVPAISKIAVALANSHTSAMETKAEILGAVERVSASLHQAIDQYSYACVKIHFEHLSLLFLETIQPKYCKMFLREMPLQQIG